VNDLKNLKVNLDLDAVKHFGLDVWEDLKRTRLAGVAVGLAVAFLAISAIVMRPGGPPEINTGYANADAAPTQEVALAVPGDEPIKLKDIDLSAPRDPFQTMDQLQSQKVAGDTAVDPNELTTASESAGGGSSGGSTETTVALDDSDALVPLDDLETTTTTTTTTDTTETVSTDDGDDGSSEPAGELEGEDDQTAPSPDYSYAADVQFGVEGSLKRYRGVERLEFVPSRSLPLLMYLGVKSDKKTMVFMVDSRLSQGGEGKCVPKPSLCTFIEVSEDAARDEHRFRDPDGEEYLLRVRGVLRTAATAGSVGGDSAPELPGTPDLVDGSR
jgi:hypothetical protein